MLVRVSKQNFVELFFCGEKFFGEFYLFFFCMICQGMGRDLKLGKDLVAETRSDNGIIQSKEELIWIIPRGVNLDYSKRS